MAELFSPCNKIGLAPMAGPGDSGFRRICREWGADYTVSEMISAKALTYQAEKTVELARFTEQEIPILLQIFGREAEAIKYAASFLSEHFSPVGIDINMGCPAPKIFNNGDGSALLNEPLLAAELVRSACEGACCPVSVKMRIGINEPDDGVIDLAKRMQDAGAAFITVHGRTREQFYSGKANYDMIRRIKEALAIPVIANGDVVDGDSAKRILNKTGADGMMLARGALGSPDVFARIKQALNGQEERLLSLEERFDVCLKQLQYTIEDKGEEKACVEFRKHMLWYLKGISGAGSFKVAAGQMRSVDDCKKLIKTVLDIKK